MQHKGYPPEFIDRVRNANNIVDVARTYLPLKQKGQDFWACCPFHHEKTPSFSVSSTKQFYYCYGCHTSGNVFGLVMHMENLSWIEAVEHLAKRANLEIPQTTENGEWLKQRAKKEKIYQALLLARDYYCRTLYLPKNQAALQYLHQRGIDDDLIKLFHIGYSDSWTGVIDALKRQGISEQIMKDAGIVGAKSNGNIWDAQFERVTFAIHDVYGNCIGFTGRTLKNDENLAKYKNTADTLVFNKSTIVYGVDVMKDKTRGQHIDGLIVVEGNVDEIAMVKHGFVNTVACMGTALTKFHANIMSRFGQKVYLCLDGDAAGQKATLRSIDTLQEAGLSVKVVTLPDRQDPDEFLSSHGAAAMQEMLNRSVGGMEFKLEYIKQHSDLSDKVGKTAYMNAVLPLLISIEAPAERELYLPDVAAAVGINVDAVRNTIALRLKTNMPTQTVKNEQNTISSGSIKNDNHKNADIPPGKIVAAEAVVMRAILQQQPYTQNLTEPLPTFFNPVYQKIIAENLQPSEIYDKLDENELKQIQPLLVAKDDLSEQAARTHWQECCQQLRIYRLERERDAIDVNVDLVKWNAVDQQIRALKQEQAKSKQKVEE